MKLFRLEKVLATEVIAKQRWKAVRLKQKFDRNRLIKIKFIYKGLVHDFGQKIKQIYKKRATLWAPKHYSDI